MTDKQTLKKISSSFIKKNETVAVAESVTGGMLQGVFASMEKAEKFFQGGITAYNLGQKAKHLHIDPIHALQCNCVSQKVSNEMAVNVCSLFESIWGIAITGYATPVPQSSNKIFAYYTVVKEGKIKKKGMLTPKENGPEVAKEFYIDSILKALQQVLK